MRQLLAMTLTLGLLAASAARAPADPVVVELFTSQGCSACPPADAFLGELAERPDVLPLALHVDYWDYIGWADQFAQPAFTLRQKAYARSGGRKMVYTPQMIVDGVSAVPGQRREEILAAITRHKSQPPAADIELVARSGEIEVRLSPVRATAAGPGADVILVRFLPRAEVAISAGENAGRRLAHSHIVTHWQVIGAWSGRELQVFRVPRAEGPGAVLVQEEGPGAYLAAALLP